MVVEDLGLLVLYCMISSPSTRFPWFACKLTFQSHQLLMNYWVCRKAWNNTNRQKLRWNLPRPRGRGRPQGTWKSVKKTHYEKLESNRGDVAKNHWEKMKVKNAWLSLISVKGYGDNAKSTKCVGSGCPKLFLDRLCRTKYLLNSMCSIQRCSHFTGILAAAYW